MTEESFVLIQNPSKQTDLIIYGSNGVCRVEAVGKPAVKGIDESRLYYTLCPLYSTERIYTPIDTNVFMRPAISRREAEELIAQIPKIEEDIFDNRNPTMLSTQYRTSIESNICDDLVRLIKSVHSKAKVAEQSGKKPGQVDKRYMKRAEELLYGELAVALDIPRDDVLGYIERKLSRTGE